MIKGLQQESGPGMPAMRGGIRVALAALPCSRAEVAGEIDEQAAGTTAGCTA